MPAASEARCARLIEQQEAAFARDDYERSFDLDIEFHHVLCDVLKYRILWENIYANRSQQISEGHRPRNTPAFTANLWTTYRFAQAWKAGLGFEAKGSRTAYGVGTCGAATQNATTRL